MYIAGSSGTKQGLSKADYIEVLYKIDYIIDTVGLYDSIII